MVSEQKNTFISWLDKQLQEKAPGTVLPTDAQLSVTFNLSLSTVRRVLTGYRNRQLIVRIAGKGTFIPGNPVSAEPDPPVSAVDDLVENFRMLFSRGEIKNGEPLPPVKTVCLQYRVSAATVTAAYRTLLKTGFIHRTGRRYWAGTFAPFSGTGSRRPVHFFYDQRNAMESVMHRSGEYFAYQKMERELLTYGFQPYYHPLVRLRDLENQWLESRDYPAGVVCMVDSEDDIRPYVNILSRIHAMSGSGTAQLCLTQNLVTSLPGTDIMLIRQHSHTTMYRLLAAFLVRKKLNSAVLFYDTTIRQPRTIGTQLRLWREMGNTDPDFKVRYAIRTRTETTVQEYIDRYVSKIGGEHTLKNLGKYGSARLEDLVRDMDLTSAASIEAVYPDYLDMGAWIFPKSDQADQAVTWLRRNGRRVPEDILVITLENDPQYLHKTITTVTPDWETIGYIMAHAIIKDIPLARTSRGHLRTAAVIKDYSEA